MSLLPTSSEVSSGPSRDQTYLPTSLFVPDTKKTAVVAVTGTVTATATTTATATVTLTVTVADAVAVSDCRQKMPTH